MDRLEQQELQTIIAYYRNRVDAFDTDRQTFFKKLELTKLRQELQHKIEWEHRKRTDEKNALLMAFEQCQAVLMRERERT